MDIIVTKWITLEGTATIAELHAEKLLKRFPAWLIREAKSFASYINVDIEENIIHELGIKAVHKVGDNGIFGALWIMAEKMNVGLEIDIRKIPVRQETIEICNFLAINPYEYLSGGMLLIFYDKGEELIRSLENVNIKATLIGKTTDKNDRIVINNNKIRFLGPKR